MPAPKALKEQFLGTDSGMGTDTCVPILFAIGDRVRARDRGNVGVITQIAGDRVLVHFRNPNTGRERTRSFAPHEVEALAHPKTGGTASQGQPEEPPRPLVRELPPSDPFPVEALDGVLGDAINAIHGIVQAPMALCGQSILAAATLSVQSHANVFLDGRVINLSEYFCTIAASGERKSATDDVSLLAHREYQAELQREYREIEQHYCDAAEAYRKSRDEALRKAKGYESKRAALRQLGDPPIAPAIPVLIMQEPTFEGLFKAMLQSRPSVGIFNDEGGTFVGGHAMNEDNRKRAAAGLSSLWSGNEVSRVRAGDGVSALRNRRLSMHLMLQPQIAKSFINDPLLLDQGLLSRVLTAWPESTAGNRLYREADISQHPCIFRYHQRMRDILRYPLPVCPTDDKQLSPRPLKLTPDAKRIWIRFYDLVEKQLGPEQPLAPIRGFANKAAEHSIRLAGTLSLVNDLFTTEIKPEAMLAGVDLAQFYLSEALRLFHGGCTDPQLELAQKLLDWAAPFQFVHLRQIYQFGPSAIREAKVARVAAGILEEHGWFEPVEGGMELDGVHRRQAWRIVNV